MNFNSNEGYILSFEQLFEALKTKNTNVEIYESVNTLLGDTDLSLKPEYCFGITSGSLIVLIDNNKELLLEIDIIDNYIVNIQADTIDAAMIANDILNYISSMASYGDSVCI